MFNDCPKVLEPGGEVELPTPWAELKNVKPEELPTKDLPAPSFDESAEESAVPLDETALPLNPGEDDELIILLTPREVVDA